MDTKELIVENAKRLFALEGYHATSMSIIAKACKKNKATLYHYYESKEVLYNEILSLHLRDLQANIGRRTLLLPDAVDQIKAYITVLVEQESEILAIINRQIIDGFDYLSAENLESLQKIQKSFDAIFKLGIASGVFHMMSPKTVYHIVFGACSHYVLSHDFLKDRQKREDHLFIEELYGIILNTIKVN